MLEHLHAKPMEAHNNYNYRERESMGLRSSSTYEINTS